MDADAEHRSRLDLHSSESVAVPKLWENFSLMTIRPRIKICDKAAGRIPGHRGPGILPGALWRDEDSCHLKSNRPTDLWTVTDWKNNYHPCRSACIVWGCNSPDATKAQTDLKMRRFICLSLCALPLMPAAVSATLTSTIGYPLGETGSLGTNHLPLDSGSGARHFTNATGGTNNPSPQRRRLGTGVKRLTMDSATMSSELLAKNR